jgi:hypothetical protein
MTIYTGTNGYLDGLEIGQVRKFLVQLRTYLKIFVSLLKKWGFRLHYLAVLWEP